jgi:hypothetical protein
VIRPFSFFLLASLALWLGSLLPAHAQWQTQSLLVKPGWTAIYLHVDASYTNLDSLIGGDPNNPITEVWLWAPAASTIQYVTSPQAPLTGSSQWSAWVRGTNGSGIGSTLASLVPNAAYLVHSVATTDYTWTVKGKPAAPNYTWTTTGINLIGFPTVPTAPPDFATFLSPVPNLLTVATIYQYNGGDLGPNNPSLAISQGEIQPWPVPDRVNRSEAFWIQSGSYFNKYFGPFQVALGASGVAFGDSTSRSSFHLLNTTATNVTVQLQLLPSETPPAGQTPVWGLPPLVVRGALNSSNLTYSASDLTTNNSFSWILPPQGRAGSDIVINLGVNRVAFTNNPGGLYAGILKFTDTTCCTTNHYTEVDVPVSAQPANYGGLWVGAAAVSQVASYIKTYQRDTNDNPVMGTNGAYVVTGTNTSLGNVSTPFPLRLIVHNDGTNAFLLQRVFFGSDIYSNTIVTTSESKLDPAQLGAARRITAVQFPYTPTNQTWAFAGQLLPGGTLSTTVDLPYDDQAANPFLHTYHPNHDNLNATFKTQENPGVESYEITRAITLNLGSTGDDYDSLTQFGQSFQGVYTESIGLYGLNSGTNATRTFNVTGNFVLNRISPIAALTRP